MLRQAAFCWAAPALPAAPQLEALHLPAAPMRKQKKNPSTCTTRERIQTAASIRFQKAFGACGKFRNASISVHVSIFSDGISFLIYKRQFLYTRDRSDSSRLMQTQLPGSVLCSVADVRKISAATKTIRDKFSVQLMGHHHMPTDDSRHRPAHTWAELLASVAAARPRNRRSHNDRHSGVPCPGSL